MVTVQTRQNKKGNWWCNATINGQDVSFEDESMENATAKMTAYLEENLRAGVVTWEPYKPYEAPPATPKSNIGYKRVRIDHNPIA